MIVIRGITNVHGDIEIALYKHIYTRQKEFDEHKKKIHNNNTHSEIYRYVRVCLFISSTEYKSRGEMSSE